MRLFFIFAFIWASQASAQTTAYKCIVGEKNTYQQTPCRNADIQENLRIKAPKRSQEFTDREWELISKNQVAIGMSEAAVLRSWGSPNDINRSGMGSDQWVYDRGRNGNQYVYIRNGRVTNWSD